MTIFNNLRISSLFYAAFHHLHHHHCHQAKERIRELEKELESLQSKLAEQEDKSNKMYLHMYSKESDSAGPSTSRVSEIYTIYNQNCILIVIIHF